MKKIILFGISIILLGLTACSKFLEVKPLDSIMEDELFTSVKGFNTALNGVYAEMNSADIYGENLTVGLVDVMAQYYDVTTVAEHRFRYFNTYDYQNTNYKGKIEAIWQKTYNLVSNLNSIVVQSDKQKSMLGDTYYAIFKGESMAMRAFLHFDMLRLFGSTYAEDSGVKVMPYVKTTSRDVSPLLTNKELTDSVISDLLIAKSLLENEDPILIEGVLNNDGERNNYLNYRQYRMNYFAVCGLLARVYLWKGDKQNALKYAQEVISLGQSSGNEIFPFVTSDAVLNRSGYPDRVFSTEVLFSLYHSGRTNVFNQIFNSTLNAPSILTFTGALADADGRVQYLYKNENDYRLKAHWDENIVGNNKVLFLNKFANVADNNGVSNAYRFMMPLIRISEMYLIAAETANSLEESTRYYNIIRVNRGLPELLFNNTSDLEEAIQNEYLKEFIGEGQAYFYFKRLQKSEIPSPVRPGIDVVQVDKVHYIMPLPESEISQRN